MDQTNMLLDLYNRIITLEQKVNELEQKIERNDQTVIPPQSPAYSASCETNSQYLPTYEKDNTQYEFNGIVYGKGRLVLAVVKMYFSLNPDMTATELTASFNPRLQGALGVIRTLDEAKASCSDYERRFFTKNDEIIHTTTGDCVVCSQWGKHNIDGFITRSRELGMTITEIRKK